MDIKKCRAGVAAPVAGERPGRTSSSTKLLAKYASLKSVNCQISTSLRELGQEKLSDCLRSCGAYLLLREYLETGKMKLRSGNFCNKHLLCPCCSAARSRRLLAKWLPILFDGRGGRCRHYMLTLTWPPPRRDPANATACRARLVESEEVLNLRANLAVGQRAWYKLWDRRKKRLSGPLKAVLGAIVATEVTRGPSGEWHPHFHVLVTLPRNVRISAGDLREDWCKLTGGRQIRLDPLVQESDVVEVFKYALKPADLDEQGKVKSSAVADRVNVYQALKGARLVRGYGCYYGMAEPDLTEQESLDDQGEWVELIFRWLRGEYQFIGERG